MLKSSNNKKSFTMENKFFPCLWQNGTGKQAAELYSEAFGNTTIVSDNGMVVIIEISGCKVMLLNGGPMFTPNPSISLFAMFESETGLNTAWQKLIEGGKALMALDKYPWSDKYGWLQDQFGVSWQLMLAKPGAG